MFILSFVFSGFPNEVLPRCGLIVKVSVFYLSFDNSFCFVSKNISLDGRPNCTVSVAG